MLGSRTLVDYYDRPEQEWLGDFMVRIGSHSATAQTAVKSPQGVVFRSRINLILMAVLYTVWLVWLLYVGIVNFQAGNQ